MLMPPDECTSEAPLRGARICLVFEHSLSHYTRLLQEIRALQRAGATVELLTSFENPEDAPSGIDRTYAPLERPFLDLPGSQLRWRPARIADNLARNALRKVVNRLHPEPSHRDRLVALRPLVEQVDVFWVVDYPSLPTVMSAVRGTSAKVVYETVDLVPEYQYLGEEHRARAVEGERRLIGQVDGFITACDSYADYYVEMYGESGLARRPVVRDNMPDKTVDEVRHTSRPIRLLFLGSLMFDRPVEELLEAMHGIHDGVTLTFQGKNYLGGAVTERVEELGLHDRVQVVDPCPPERIVDTAAEYDVGIVALRGENENERRASTSKLFTYMAAGLAILGSDLPGIARIVNEHHNGILARGADATAWAEAIEAVETLTNAEIDAMKQRSIEASRRYSWDVQEPAFIAEFCRALGVIPAKASETA